MGLTVRLELIHKESTALQQLSKYVVKQQRSWKQSSRMRGMLYVDANGCLHGIQRLSNALHNTMIVPSVWFVGVILASAVAMRHKTSTQAVGARSSATERPALVQEALANQDKVMYYFGLGSNMLRSKLENRGVNGSKIEILEMEPAVVSNHRLSFNMRGFLPLEPGMGSLEPVDSDSKALHAYDQPECHGALVTLTPENYEKVMQSEGVGPNVTNPGYEEVVVTVIPYDKRKNPVQAVALRARPHVRLKKDPCPSERYMAMLKEGAAELQLVPDYQKFLSKHPVQKSPAWLKRIALYNLIFNFTLSFTLKWRGLSRLQSWCLFKVYVPSTATALQRIVSDVLMGFMLLPGAWLGVAYRLFLKATSREVSPVIQRFILMVEGHKPITNETST